MKLTPFGPLIPWEVAQRRLLDATVPVAGVESARVSDALGRVAARAIRAPRPVPATPRATWDGYALRAAGTRKSTVSSPTRLRVVGEIFAEGSFDRAIQTGEAVAIATGGSMPAGTDAVLIFERTQLVGDSISVSSPVRSGERVARPGDDFRRGTILVPQGSALDPAAVGAVGAAGVDRLLVRRRPVVTLIPNGNELREPGHPYRPGVIYEINNLTLGAVARANGARVETLRPVVDDPAQIRRALRSALRRSDLVIATGGSSVGERDYLPGLFPEFGDLLFHGVAVRPGKPTLAAKVGRRLLIGMPGHPTSCLLNAFWLLQPVLRKAAGLPGPGWTEERARLRGRLSTPSPDMATVVPLHLEGGWARSTFRDSSAITSLRGANGYTVLSPGARAPPSRSTIPVCRLANPVGISAEPA